MRRVAALCLGLFACSADEFADPDAGAAADSAPPSDTGVDAPRPDAMTEAGAVDGGGADAAPLAYCQANVFPGNLLFCEDFDNGTAMPPASWSKLLDVGGMAYGIDGTSPVSKPNRFWASHPTSLPFPNQALLRRTGPVNNAPMKIEFEFRLQAITTGRTEFLKITPTASVHTTVALLAGQITLMWGAGGTAVIPNPPLPNVYYHGSLVVDYPNGNALLAVTSLGTTGQQTTLPKANPGTVQVDVGLISVEGTGSTANTVSLDNIVATKN